MSTFRSVNSRYRRTTTYHNDKVVKLVKKTLRVMRGTTNNVPNPAGKTSLKFVEKAGEKKKDSAKKHSVNQAVLLVENREKVEENPQVLVEEDHCVGKKRKANDLVEAEMAPKIIRRTVSFAENNNSLSPSCEKSSIKIGGKQVEKYNLFELKWREKIQKHREESRRKLEELEKSTVVMDDLDVELELMRLLGCKTRGWFIDYQELSSWAFQFH